jgi:glycosyltransferase involved in cell wall biosynthesis
MTTRLTSLPDVAGDAALYVDPQDPAELANAFIRLAGSADLRDEMGQRGLERARRFSWTTSAALMDELISAHL